MLLTLSCAHQSYARKVIVSDTREHDRIETEIDRTELSSDPFTAAMRATRMPMFVTDPKQPDNPIVFVNNAFCALTGYERDEILDRDCHFLDGPGTSKTAIDEIREALAGHVPIKIELLNYKKSGEEFWNNLLISPVFDNDGELTYFFASLFDTTEHRAAEYRLDALIRSSSEVRYSLNADWSELTQLSGGDFIPDTTTADKGWLDAYIPLEDRDAVRREIERAIRTKSTYMLEHRVNRIDGTVGWAHSRAVPLLDSQGAITEWFGAASDITDRKRAEAALRESEERLRVLNETLERRVEEAVAERDRAWDNTRDLLLLADTGGTFRQVNAAWTQTLGWERSQLIGRNHLEFIHPDDHFLSDQALGVALENQLPLTENRLRHKNGEWRWISRTATSPEGGKVFAVGRDVTEEKARKQALLLHENIVQSHRSPVLAFDRELRVIAFNRAHSDEFLRVFGVEAVAGVVLPDLFPPDQALVIRSHMVRALTGDSFTVVEEFGDPELAKPHWEVAYYPLRDEAGAIMGHSITPTTLPTGCAPRRSCDWRRTRCVKARRWRRWAA